MQSNAPLINLSIQSKQPLDLSNADQVAGKVSVGRFGPYLIYD